MAAQNGAASPGILALYGGPLCENSGRCRPEQKRAFSCRCHFLSTGALRDRKALPVTRAVLTANVVLSGQQSFHFKKASFDQANKQVQKVDDNFFDLLNHETIRNINKFPPFL